MHEITVNLHMHTRYSDGYGSHSDIAAAALKAGVDVVIVTDHNVWVNGPEGYVRDGSRRVLMLVGEEIHDAGREPQKNHLLVFGAERELAHLADEPQKLINGVREAGGLCFLAHPFDEASRFLGEPDIAWEDWQVQGYTGVELWNGLSELKSLLKTRMHALFYAFNPGHVPHGPPPEMVKKWDKLLADGRRIVAVGGSDAHQLPGKMGPLRRTIFPYATHFKSINTHLLLPAPLTGDEAEDRDLVYGALRAGHAFIGNDQLGPTLGFRFHGQGPDGDFLMGDEVRLGVGVTLQVRLPQRAHCVLKRNGLPFKTWSDRETVVNHIDQPGVYRLEAGLNRFGMKRAWIISNPVYIR